MVEDVLQQPMTDDAFLRALTALEEVIADNERRSALIRKRMVRIRRARERGIPYTESVVNEDGPLIVRLLTEAATALDTCGAHVRRAEAQALYDEGMTMERIAKHFGVTRQRVSALLRKDRPRPR